MACCAALRVASLPASHTCHWMCRSLSTAASRLSNFLFAHLAGHAHLFQLHFQLEDLFEKIGRDARWILLSLPGLAWFLACMLLANLRAFELEQILGAMKRRFQRPIRI